jgi:RNA polymerase sigma-70 factor (ECF subfamily)
MKGLEAFEIEAILDDVARGNRDAFRWIVRAYSLPLRCFLCSQIYRLDDVDDLTQEVFLAAFQDLPTFRRGDDFGAWLCGIARHKLHDYFRSTARRRQALARFQQEVARVVEADLERAAAHDSSEAIEVLLRCIGRLPEKLCRVVRAGLDGIKPEVLAENLSTSVGAIYNLHYRANQLLRECMRKELD